MRSTEHLVPRHLDRMEERLRAAIQIGSRAGACQAKAELHGALELALEADLLPDGEFLDRWQQAVELYYQALETRVLRED